MTAPFFRSPVSAARIVCGSQPVASIIGCRSPDVAGVSGEFAEQTDQQRLKLPATMATSVGAYGISVFAAVIFFFGGAAHRSYPVIDAAGRLHGLASRSGALRWQIDGDLNDVFLADALSDPMQPFAFRHSPIGEVADQRVATDIGQIPIVDEVTVQVVGILSRHDLLKARAATRRTELERV
ncbi:CBS domain-containing protein [Parablastomonas sp. CN1-191]|uniref:CBS domain-containing protein n=1 Tax=Parablastomonas sp. CN1-191 TaxID=3400908 RepID=UPI003BF92242